MVTVIASQPELIVMRWLTENDIPFDFQTSLMGGHFSLGGSVLDFILIELNIGLRVQGIYWHQGVAKKGTDDIQRENLEALGLTIVDIWEDDLATPAQVEETMTKAVQGIEMLH